MKRLPIYLLLVLAFAMQACEEEEPVPPANGGGGQVGSNPYCAGNGAVTFYCTPNANIAISSLTFGGTNLGGFTQYYTQGSPTCGQSISGTAITAIRPAGAYNWCATRSDGDTYSGTINVTDGGCTLRGISSSDMGSCGGSTGTCNWQLNPSYVTVNAVMSDMCGEPNGGITLTMTNQSSQPIRIGVCIELNSGNWYSTADGTFDAGVAPGQSVTAWNCYATGQWKIFVLPLNTFVANNCSFPSCS